MKKTNYIQSLIFFLMVLLAPAGKTYAQYINSVCSGSDSVMYSVVGSEGSEFFWTIEGGKILVDLGDTIYVKWNKEGDYTLEVLEQNIYGCTGDLVSGIVKVFPNPLKPFGTPVKVCQGSSLTLDAGRAITYRWNNGETSRYIDVNQQGTYTVEITNEFGCKTTDSVFLAVKDLPNVDLGEDVSLCLDERLVLDPGEFRYYDWSTNEISRTITVFEGPQEIWVRVTDENDCMSSDTIVIQACNKDNPLGEIVNTITPNDDGKNDTWIISEKMQFYPQAVVEIYDRWGRMVFKSDVGYSTWWDGTMNGKPLPMDSYYYIIDLHNGTDLMTGTITIIR